MFYGEISFLLQSDDENSFLLTFLTGAGLPNNFWLDANDFNVEGVWTIPTTGDYRQSL